MAKVVRLRAAEAHQDSAVVCGAAMREARDVAGLDLDGAARRLNAALGTSVIGVGLLRCWESGMAPYPDAPTFIEAVRLAGEQAAAIFASLA